MASLLFLRQQGLEVTLATYDVKLQMVAEKLGVPLSPLATPP